MDAIFLYFIFTPSMKAPTLVRRFGWNFGWRWMG
jgi:hypothetical protein